MLREPYRIVAGSRQLQPICDLELVGPERVQNIQALIDSGADFTIFPVASAVAAGIGIGELRDEIQYGGSTTRAFWREAVFRLSGLQIRTRVAFVETLQFPYALLGRYGVFARFGEVAFVESSPTHA